MHKAPFCRLTTHARKMVVIALLAFGFIITSPLTASAQSGFTVDGVLKEVVQVVSKVPAKTRTVRILGTNRDGSGVIIDSNGLVLTIGYAILEAESTEIVLSSGKRIAARAVAYDHASGFGLLRANENLTVKPVELGDSSDLAVRDPILMVSHGGRKGALPGIVVSRRPFAGSWEYMLEKAIYTAPPHPAFGGAALFSDKGRLVGIGSLIVGDALEPGHATPGNMFIPIDHGLDSIHKKSTADYSCPVLLVAGQHKRQASKRGTLLSASPENRYQV